MKSFWALPALLRVALATKHSFSVNDDILAFPQFEIKYTDHYITEDRARSLLNGEDLDPSDASHTNAATALQKQDPGTPWPSFKDAQSHTDVTYETLQKNGRQYLCSIPSVKLTAPGDKNATRTAQEERAELERTNARGWELLSQLQGDCIFYWAGWWTYRYCFGEGVKQFHEIPRPPGKVGHPVEDPNVQGFMLGTIGDADDKAVPAENSIEARANSDIAVSRSSGSLETKAGVKYLVQKLDGGTVCDLTGKERKIEVQFHCSQKGDDKIDSIKETATCAYLMVIKIGKLCEDVAFLPPQRDDPNFISCAPVLAPEQVESYEAELHHSAQAAAHAFPNPFTSKPRPRVGSFEVGAHAFIPEGREIETPAAVGGSEGETVVDVIASSEGISSTAEQLRKLGITKPEQIEKLQKQLDRLAGEKGWKIEVVDTPDGREYRGTIGNDGEGDGPLGEAGDAQEGAAADADGDDKEAEMQRRKKEAVKELLRQEGADEVIVLWDDGDGEVVVDEYFHDEL
ncbi:hypothetical protein ANO11243_085360 [Dothideomycetidae sp. 11243]|nr:hypothetical protein ANO11243_085360 [fungal sp. No.11243]